MDPCVTSGLCGVAAASAEGRFLSPLAVAGSSECNIHPINCVNPAAGTGFHFISSGCGTHVGIAANTPLQSKGEN